MNVADLHATVLTDKRRIVVIGCSGSGKSTLSGNLSRLLGLPHIPMDRAFFWLPGWQLRDRGEIRRMMADAALGERWIMDGNSPGTLDLRLPRADLMIWMRLPRRLCVWRVVRRWWQYSGRARPDMAEGCPEKIDLAFLRYIWNFERKESPEIAAMIEVHNPDLPVLLIRSTADIDALLARLEGAV